MAGAECEREDGGKRDLIARALIGCNKDLNFEVRSQPEEWRYG